MATRITGPIDLGRWEVYVNARPVTPFYNEEPKAIKRAEREAKTHRHVQVARVFTDRPPRTVATWEDGKRTR